MHHAIIGLEDSTARRVTLVAVNRARKGKMTRVKLFFSRTGILEDPAANKPESGGMDYKR
jgi:hypothetical protein